MQLSFPRLQLRLEMLFSPQIKLIISMEVIITVLSPFHISRIFLFPILIINPINRMSGATFLGFQLYDHRLCMQPASSALSFQDFPFLIRIIKFQIAWKALSGFFWLLQSFSGVWLWKWAVANPVNQKHYKILADSLSGTS
ncbi:MAG: hypothetical protein ACD_2C00264G0014 [uncultured bacterium (gcode 4)]|uniref:Uncharacterized protein n=1 Tax=uncultured bacterium (gcode 4) TaxID=1234023 RepID=K2GF44_9BACT|nr:MAG: hypothetical protein ACD_2C00264G0014 [uncultured bacterium (gcode 4)]